MVTARASCQAITYRCEDVGIVGQPLYEELFGVFKEKGWRAKSYKEADAMPPGKELPRWLERLCYRALAEGATAELVKCHGVLWLIDLMHTERVVEAAILRAGLEQLARHPRCRLPRAEIDVRLVWLDEAPSTPS